MKDKKKIIAGAAIIIAIILLAALYRIYRHSNTKERVVDINIFSQSAIVMNDKGKILYQREPDKKLQPSSITKLLAVAVILIAQEQGALSFEDDVEITALDLEINASQAGFIEGDTVSIYDLIMATMVPSGSEAIRALGRHVFGDEAGLVEEMNNLAKQIGMDNSNFTNTVGIDKGEHYSTAYDLALLSKYLIENHPNIYEFTQMRSYVYRGDNGREVPMINTNEMLIEEGVNGLKTGSDPMYGYNLVFTYENRGRYLIFVVLGSPEISTRRTDSKTLLEAFR